MLHEWLGEGEWMEVVWQALFCQNLVDQLKEYYVRHMLQFPRPVLHFLAL